MGQTKNLFDHMLKLIIKYIINPDFCIRTLASLFNEMINDYFFHLTSDFF